MRISQNLILIPVFVQVALTFVVLFSLFPARVRSVKSRQQKLKDIAAATDADWERSALKISNNFKSQFEIPVLFYVVCLFAFVMRLVDVWFLGLAALFVTTRIVHSLIHTRTDIVKRRFYVYLTGVLAVLAMWCVLGAHLVVAGL